MNEFFEAIANHPWVAIFIAIFILAVLSAIEDIVKAARKNKN